ncbi:hypothetical protein ARAM_005316 [Aspergillus rambellii]|uniref:Myosin class II heavy chain (MHC) n=1 Tax=Aspergillus rambellii TaxID=308745 RepID=A0A0F8UXL3_9EURO|nr:hypothetical protein ARAM_005316 [Aspergillus rambellii]
MAVDLDHSASSANSALSPPPPHSTNPSSIRDPSHLSASLQSSFNSPAAASRSAAGSPGQPTPPRDRSGAPNQQPSTLPSLPKYRVVWDSSTSSPEDKKAESSIYYTTAWGSPYAAPSPRRLSFSLSHDAGIDRESGVSSPASINSGINFGLEPNSSVILRLPSDGPAQEPRNQALERSPERERERLSRKAGKSIRDFTQDWINQYLSGQPRTERSNWLSDDSGSEAPSFFTAQNHFADDGSDDWLGLEHDSREDDLLKTPTLADFVSGRARASRRDRSSTRPRVKESLHKRADTLRQEDFWGFAYDKDPPSIGMSTGKDPQPSAEITPRMSSPVEKPLPPPPVDQKGPFRNMEPAGNPSEARVGQIDPNTSVSLRQRKKIPWRGKGCIIYLPADDKRGTEESGYRLLTAEDVNQGLKQWEELGYDTRGFTICASDDASNTILGGASRPLYPDPLEMRDEVGDKSYEVKFPNKALWDDYVNYLQEEKLRALGVSLGEDELQPSVSPASALNSMTPFPGLVSSPPIPTASAASNPLSLAHPFSPPLNQQTPNLPNGLGSIASPASQFGGPPPFFGVDQTMLPGYLPFQPTPPTHGSLTPQSFFNLRQNAAPASTIPATLSSLTSMLSPVSPLADQNSFHPGFNDHHGQPMDGFDDQLVHRTHDEMLHDEYVDAHILRPLRTPPPNPDNFHASTVEIAQPTPRGHSRGHNLSETLQKGIDQFAPDYHLEESIERELDDAGDLDPTQQPNFDTTELLKSRWALPAANNHIVQHIPQHMDQFYGGAYSGNVAHEGSDIDTNPSLSGTPRRNGSLHHIPWHESKPSTGSYVAGHRSKLSTSTLNVDAKEFDPTGPPAAQSVRFPTLEHSMFTFGSVPEHRPVGGLNVAAPSFTPGGVAAGPSYGQNNDGPHEFSFSSPTLNIAAAEFNPGSSIRSIESEEATPATKIFKDINFSEMSKPAKKSKAIPIVRPDNNKEDDREEDDEADNGDRQRVTSDRLKKRVRRGGAAGSSDEEARYSVPHALTETNNQALQAMNVSHMPAEGKENALPERGDFATDAKTLVQDDTPIERKDTPVSEASTWAPLGTKDQDAMAPQDSAEPDHIHHQAPDSPVDNKPETLVPRPDDQDQRIEPTEANTGLKGPVFSPTAKPFHFKPSIAEFVPVFTEPPQPPPKDPPKDTFMENKGLMISTSAVASLPAESEQEPEPGVSASELEAKVHVLDDVFQAVEDSPDEEQLNAIMEQLNDDSDLGIERLSTPQPASHLLDSVLGPSKEKKHVHADNRSEPASPSPGRGPVSHTLHVPKLDFDAQSHFSATPSKGVISRIQSPIRQLMSRNEHVSDWGDMISSGEDVKLADRSRFFDRRINELLASTIEKRLSPLERALNSIQQSLVAINTAPLTTLGWRSTSAEVMDSDADDEDEEYEEDASSYKARSPIRRRDRKLEKLKSVILEALETREIQPAPEPAPLMELIQLRETVAELHAMTAQKLSDDNTASMREMMQEVMASQRSRPSEAEEIGADSLMLQVEGLKSMLRTTDERAESEYKKRREAQDTVSELQRLLKMVEDDATRHSAAAESAEARLLQLQEEKMPYFENIQQKANALEKERENIRLTLDEFSSKNITLQGTLDEYRVLSDNWKRESEENKAQLDEVSAENRHLRNTITTMAARIEDGLNIRQNLSEKLDRIQDEMATVTRDVTRNQASWRRKEEELNARHNELRASHNRETKLREQLEEDITKLEEQEREATKLKFIFGQSQQENARLEEIVNDLRQKNYDLEIKAARFEREFNEARESSRVEIQRTRTSLETDLEAANNQVNFVRAELESQILRLQTQLDNVKLDSDTSRERYEMLLEEAHETKANSLASMNEAKELALEDQRKLHERALNDLRERHARALHNASEDRQRAESHLEDRLALSDDKVKHFQERVVHLEEKLEIAQSAARAAAEAARSAKAGTLVESAQHSGPPSMSFSTGSSVPEKISPQALRESILVLQDQLQQRETRIEELEQEVAAIDKDAPAKLKEKDTEINWLRELLEVRLNDLQDIITTVSQPSFNHNAVRDAAIRLKANLQMQQQERERALNGQGFPSFPSLSEITASPRSLPLAAAAAWGNWRKGRENSSSNASEQTPSKPSNASAFLSGLLTPPSSNARQINSNSSAPPATGWRRPSESRPLKSYNTTPRPLSSRAGKMREPPTTPPLMRRSSYDHDAEPTDYPQSSLEDEIESTVDGLVSASPKETDGPFGPQIA